MRRYLREAMKVGQNSKKERERETHGKRRGNFGGREFEKSHMTGEEYK